jgi:hypothetical protein
MYMQAAAISRHCGCLVHHISERGLTSGSAAQPMYKAQIILTTSSYARRCLLLSSIQNCHNSQDRPSELAGTWQLTTVEGLSWQLLSSAINLYTQGVTEHRPTHAAWQY